MDSTIDDATVLLAKDLVVVRVAADPEPHEAIGGFDRECSMTSSNASRPETTHLLEVEGRMMRVVLQVA